MFYLIGLLSIIFFALAISVISKSIKLNKSLVADENTDDALDSNNNANAYGMIIFWALGTIAGVWSFMVAKPDFLPIAASEHGVKTDSMFWTSMAVVTLAFFVSNTLLLYFAFKYRYNKNRKATFYPVNHKLELIWTVIPAIVMAILVFTGWRTWRDITSQAPSDAVVIEITGHQFGWYVRYAGNDDNQLGNFNYKLIDETNNIGIDFTDKNSFDDFTATELHLPKGKPVLLKIKAQDVLHSVYLPFHRVKMDAVPGMPTKFWFTPNISTDEMRAKLGKKDFNFKVNCTEVVDYKEGEGLEEGCVLWVCKTPEGKLFSCRPRGTREDRVELFKNGDKYVGKKLTVRFQELTNDKVPRFPVGITFRDYE